MSTHTTQIQGGVSSMVHLKMSRVVRGSNPLLGRETLEAIFQFAAEGMAPIKFPLDLKQLPWVLGRVSSLWRRVSRSLPILWKTEIDFNFHWRKQALKAVQHGADILPPVTCISLSVVSKASDDPVSPAEMLPFLHRVDELKWSVESDPAQHLLLDTLSPGSLSNVQRLEIRLPTGSRFDPLSYSLSRTLSELFGSSPRLEHLCASSPLPLLTFSHRLWKNLRSLDIAALVDGESALGNAAALWDDHWSSYKGLSALENLTVAAPFRVIEDFISSTIPWHQLKYLTINPPHLSHNSACELIISLLPRLTSLLKLSITEISLGKRPEEIDDLQSPFSATPTLHLRLSKEAFVWIENLHCVGLWTAFTSLELYDVPPDQLYQILSYCKQLISLTISILPEDPEGDGYVMMPNLLHLKIQLQDFEGDNSDNDYLAPFPSPLLVPALTSLEVSCAKVHFEDIIEFVEHSAGKLTSFVWDDEVVADLSEVAPRPDDRYVRKFLTLLSSASLVNLTAFSVSSDILDSIADRTLLPQVTSLALWAESPDDMISAISRRLALEEKQAKLGLQEVTVYHVDDSSDDEIDMSVLDMSMLDKYRGRVRFSSGVRDYPDWDD